MNFCNFSQTAGNIAFLSGTEQMTLMSSIIFWKSIADIAWLAPYLRLSPFNGDALACSPRKTDPFNNFTAIILYRDSGNRESKG
jgi:hypothetical protein